MRTRRWSAKFRIWLTNLTASCWFYCASSTRNSIVLLDDLREIKTRVGILEQQYASMSNRIDRIEFRLERIERRLELAEA